MNKEQSSQKIRRLFAEKGALARAKNDEIYGSDFDDIADDIGDTFDVLSSLMEKTPPVPDNVFMAATMNWGVLNMLISAVELYRLGYYKEPMMIVRNAIETVSVAHAITADEETYKKFIADPEAFDSPKAIKEAKQVVGLLGRAYGLLSRFFTHPGSLHVIPHEVKNAALYIGGYLHDDEDGTRGRLSILMLKQSISSICMLVQAPSVWNDGGSRYWEKQPDGVTFVGRPAAEKARAEIEEMGRLLSENFST